MGADTMLCTHSLHMQATSSLHLARVVRLSPVHTGVSALGLTVAVCGLWTTAYPMHLATAVQPCYHLARKQIIHSLQWPLAMAEACAGLHWCLSALAAGETVREGCGVSNTDEWWSTIYMPVCVQGHGQCTLFELASLP